MPKASGDHRTPHRPVLGTLADGERRSLTVLFCDLVGSTELAARLDPEDWRDVLERYRRVVGEAVSRFDGRVARILGDGVIACFGEPEARPDEAARAAAWASLNIIEEAAALDASLASRGIRLAVRLGLHSAEVSVDGDGQIFGTAPDLADRVQAAATPGSVFATGATIRLLADTFLLGPETMHALPGISDPVWLRRVLGPVRGEERFPAEARASGPAEARAETPSPEGERRQLTVLFCALAGSDFDGDLERWRTTTESYLRAVGECARRFAGHVARVAGDGVVIYFGWPQAHDDDAERAVRAGLGILDALADLRLSARLGLHTGTVVIDEAGRIFGDTPHVAARVQAVSQPDTLPITAATLRLVAGLFLVDDGTPRALKGIREPVVLHRVHGPSGVRSRFHASVARGLVPLIGRSPECDRLVELWRHARRGEGRLVLVGGEPGIGKSRLVHALREAITAERHTWVDAAGSPFHRDTPFHPIAEILRSFFRDPGEGEPEARLVVFERALGRLGLDVSQSAPLLAPLLAIPLGDRYAPPVLSPRQQRERLFLSLRAWVLGMARLQPLVIAFEDLQWVDASSLELLTRLLDEASRAPLLLLCTARPEFHPPWPADAPHERVFLHRLGQDESRALVREVPGTEALAQETIEAIVRRTDGVPLFVEELTRLVVERGDEQLEATIPTTLTDSLMARLDRLGAAKEIAQVGAVIGREFSRALLEAVLPDQARSLESRLAALVGADLLLARGVGSEASYEFRHALIHEAAYASLLKRTRRALHRTIATVLTERFPMLADNDPATLARHHTEAGDADPATSAWQRAGERARSRAALEEATEHYRRAISVLSTLPAGPQRAEREIKLQTALVQALWATRGWSAPEVRGANDRIRNLAAEAGNPARHFFALFALWVSTITAGEIAAAANLADRSLEAAESIGAPAILTRAHWAKSATAFHRGALDDAATHSTRALAFYSEEEHQRSPNDIGISALAYAAYLAWHQGRADEARRLSGSSIELARRRGILADLGFALLSASHLHVDLREPSRVLELTRELRALAIEHGFPIPGALADVFGGWAAAITDGNPGAIASVRKGVAAVRATGHGLAYCRYLGLLAELEILCARPEAALETVNDALLAFPEDRIFHPELLRVRAEARVRLGATVDDAESAYRESLDVASRHGDRAGALRATLGLARLRSSPDRSDEARRLLERACEAAGRGGITVDVREARALLASS